MKMTEKIGALALAIIGMLLVQNTSAASAGKARYDNCGYMFDDVVGYTMADCGIGKATPNISARRAVTFTEKFAAEPVCSAVRLGDGVIGWASSGEADLTGNLAEPSLWAEVAQASVYNALFLFDETKKGGGESALWASVGDSRITSDGPYLARTERMPDATSNCPEVGAGNLCIASVNWSGGF